MTAAEALRGFLDALRDDPAKPLPADPSAQAALYRSLLAQRRILIVLDNARDEEQVRPLLPGSGNSLTLITSRDRLAGLVTIEGAIPVSLGLLTDAEAHELLNRRLGLERVTAEPSAAALLISVCAGLPLALCIAAARAALAPTLPLAALSAQIGRPGLDALSGTDPYADLRSVFSWSYQRLSPVAVGLSLALWSIFLHRALWHEMLDTQRIGLDAARRAGDLNAEAWLGHSLFAAYNGLGRSEEGIAGLRRSLAISEAQCDLRGQGVVHRLLAAAYDDTGRVPEAITEYEQAIAMSRECGDRSSEGRALNNMGWMFQHVAEPERALSLYRAAYAIAAALPEPQLAGTAQANLAGLYLELGRGDDAIAAATTAIEINERCGHGLELANAHRVLGDALQRLGRDAEAREHWRTALAGYQELHEARAEEMKTRLRRKLLRHPLGGTRL